MKISYQKCFFNGQIIFQDPCRWSLAFQTYVQLTMLGKQ